jgi:sulfate permease, SulP family
MSEHTVGHAGPRGPLEFLREAAGGVSSTFVLLAQMLTLGLIAYGSLGPVAVESGVRAAFAAAIYGNLTAAVLGGALLPNEIPRASTVLVFAAFVSRLVGDPVLRTLPGGGPEGILFLSALCLALAGVIQVGFGVLRLGSIARFVPYPVVAGLMTGLAISLVFYELPHILGTHAEGGGEHGGGAAHGGWEPWTLLVALFTIANVVVIGRRWPKAPSKLIGVAVGTVVSVILAYAFHSVDLGPRLPELRGRLPAPDSLFPLLSGDGLRLVYKYAYELLISAAAIAVIGALDSLLAAVGEMDGPLDTGHQPNRLLIALGLGNVMSGLFGGVPLAYSSHHALVTHHDASGRSVMPSVVTTGTLVLLLLYGGPLLQQIPVAVLAGVMTVIAIGLIDRWAGAVVQRARRQQFDRELTVNIVLVVFVAGITIIFGLVTAVVTGLIVSMALFIAMMNRSLVRAVSTGETRASRRVYPPDRAKLLRDQGKRIKLIDIDGAIFFGTSDRLGAEAQRAAIGASFVILDLRRVTMIDASGALMLERLSKSLRDQGIRLMLAHLSPTSPLGKALQGAGAFTEKHRPDWFADSDRALEWAERQLLAAAHLDDERHEIRIGELALMAGLSAAELEFMKPYLDRQLLPPRAPLFREGQKGDRMYLLARGAVSIVTEDPSAANKHRRIVTLAPGVIFGESAMLEGTAHSVTAIAEEEIVLYSLSRGSLDAIRAVAPDLYRRLLLNLLAHLAALLRMTAGVLRENSDSVQ